MIILISKKLTKTQQIILEADCSGTYIYSDEDLDGYTRDHRPPIPEKDRQRIRKLRRMHYNKISSFVNYHIQ